MPCRTVNNAGIYEFAPLEQVTAENFHKQFNLNVLGLIAPAAVFLASSDSAWITGETLFISGGNR